MPTGLESQIEINCKRQPLPRERLRRFLVEAGANGLTAHELAKQVYGENSNVTRCRVRELVSSLRWNDGVEIILIKDAGFLVGRYVLQEFIPAAKP